MLLNEMKVSKKKIITTENKIGCAACPVPFTKHVQRFAAVLVRCLQKIFILEDLLNIKESSLQLACFDL